MFGKANAIKILSDWPQPRAGAPTPQLFADDSILIIRYISIDDKTAVIFFPLVHIFRFGSPNDEALIGHPLFNNGLKFYSVHIVKNSSWIKELERQNSVHPQHSKRDFLKDMNHYVFTFQDSTLECIVTEGEFWKATVEVFESKEDAENMFNEMRSSDNN